MGKIRKEVKKTKHKRNGGGAQTAKPGAAQGLVFNTSGYGQHILKNPQVVQVYTPLCHFNAWNLYVIYKLQEKWNHFRTNTRCSKKKRYKLHTKYLEYGRENRNPENGHNPRNRSGYRKHDSKVAGSGGEGCGI